MDDPVNGKMRNYTRTPNEILACAPDMNEAELKLTLVLVRQTYGFHVESVKMTYDDMCKAANLSRTSVSRAINDIEKRGFFRRGRKSMWFVNSPNSGLNEVAKVEDSPQSVPKSTNDTVQIVDQNSPESGLNEVDESTEFGLSPLNKERKEKEKKEKNPHSAKPPKKRRQKEKLEYTIPENLNTPDFLKIWPEFVEHREAMKKPMTSRAAKMALNKLSKHSPSAAIWALEQSIINGWQSFYPEKYQPSSPNGNRQPAFRKPQKQVVGEF